MKIWLRLTSFQLSGLGTALGVALSQALLALCFGVDAGLAAVAGAVCASLMDLPNPPERVLRRLLPAALLAAIATWLVGLAREQVGLMLPLVAVITFASLMCMAWGQRAGPLAFTAILAMVFTLAWRAPLDGMPGLIHAGWTLLGALCYCLWGLGMAHLLNARYRELALAEALETGVRRLYSRAARVEGAVSAAEASMRASIVDDVQLAEALQNARDLIFVARRDAVSMRQTEQLLNLIELRDMLLASRLDIELLGQDEAGQSWRAALAATLRELGDQIGQLAACLRRRDSTPLASNASALHKALALRMVTVDAPEDDPRRHLANALQARLGYLIDEVERMLEAQAGGPTPSADDWTVEQLRDFISPRGWPLAALRNHLSLKSPVLRHALRATLALSFAYCVGLFMPWSSHPQWLMLTVSVVLRGNLDQTLARRNGRILGTLLGCVMLLALAQAHERWLLSLVFIAAVGTAHAYVNKRYFVAATAATLMALVQPLMLVPGTHPAVLERLADTLLGALVAWAFCYVLPSWERRSVKRLLPLARDVLARHAANALQWAPTREQQLAARLSRQQAYGVLGALADSSQRTRVEPESVRLAEAEVEALLTHGYRLMALISAVHQQLARRADRLDAARTQAALPVTSKTAVQSLKAELDLPARQADEDELHDPQAGIWPEHIGEHDLTPWLLRRLRLIRREARLFNHAAVSVV